MRGKECVTDYFLRAEAASTSLKSAGETISDSLLIAMVLKGLPEEFTPFNTVVMQKDTESTFPEFKSLLRSYEESLRSREAHRPDVKSENVLKVNYKKNPDYQCGGSASGSSVRCYSCGKTGHKSFECRLKKDRGKWCKECKTITHNFDECRKANRATRFSSATVNVCKPRSTNDYSDEECCFKISCSVDNISTDVCNVLVDCGATTHIITDKSKFKCFDEDFDESKHMVELADGARYDYSGSVFVYFLKQKSDALDATKKFLADTSSYGVVKRLRCDNGGEFTSSEFKKFLVSNKVKQEFSSPNSPHQNGTAERILKEDGESEDSEFDFDNENVICNEKKATVNDNQSDPVSKHILVEDEHSEINTDLTETEREGESRYPSRERTAPKYLEEYVDPDNVDLLGYSVHYCCKVLNNIALFFKRSYDTIEISGYCDSDWGSSEDRKSISGYCYQMNADSALISWKSKKQSNVALSSCEAELKYKMMAFKSEIVNVHMTKHI
ncbi:uncharacterized protein [Palaemon carinicauda]|uniref:uncharacterized protein n=1 Tax=Palaemon carinicauda TaxID=392227 RepID=UPI0035B640A9